MTALEENPLILNSILWTDESKFTNNGVINKITVTGTIKIHIGHLKPISNLSGEQTFGVV